MVGDIEDVKHQIALLIAGATFAANLATLDTDKGDGVSTPVPTQIEECEKAQLVNHPGCRIVGLATEFEGESETAQVGTHEIAIAFVHVGDDEATVTKQVERLVRAARQTLWNSLLGGGINATPVIVKREDYGELGPGVESAFEKGGGLIVQTTTVVQ